VKHFAVTAFNKFISCYNQCVKMFGFAKYGSMSGIFIKLSLMFLTHIYCLVNTVDNLVTVSFVGLMF